MEKNRERVIPPDTLVAFTSRSSDEINAEQHLFLWRSFCNELVLTLMVTRPRCVSGGKRRLREVLSQKT
jgi:hypothetical protein